MAVAMFSTPISGGCQDEGGVRRQPFQLCHQTTIHVAAAARSRLPGAILLTEDERLRARVCRRWGGCGLRIRIQRPDPPAGAPLTRRSPCDSSCGDAVSPVGGMSRMM